MGVWFDKAYNYVIAHCSFYHDLSFTQCTGRIMPVEGVFV